MQDFSKIHSDLGGFYHLSMARRRRQIADMTGLSDEDLRVMAGDEGLCAEQANHMVENALGVTGLPLGLCVNLVVDGRDRLVPMATEEPSVVAAASHASKLLRTGGGVTTTISPPVMIGQMQLLDVPDAGAAEAAVLAAAPALLARADRCDPCLVLAGGGARGLEVRHLPPLADDPLGPMLVVHLLVDVRDAMGANSVNTMAEDLAPELERLTGGRARLRIVSNLADRRTAVAEGRVPFAALENKGGGSGEALAWGIVEASVFAERDPYRAATHNKGIMNGVDAVLIAFGQDWRAVEAGAHAFAARGGRYTALARWRVQDGALHGRLEMPLPVGTVGGVTNVHPTVQAVRRLAGVQGAADLASLTVSVGLAQNLGALRALAAEGIQKGHMRVHARNVASGVGAVGPEVETVAHLIAERGQVCATAARQALKHVRAEPAAAIPVADMHGRYHVLRDSYLPAIQEVVDEVLQEAHAGGSTLGDMCRYQMDTGGKRVRAVLPLMVAEALGVDPSCMVPFGAACEMLHNAMVVHDDLQDRSPARRGQPAVWAQFGEAQALNLGDAMLYYTLALINRLEVPPARRQMAVWRALRETMRVLDGQERESALRRSERPSLDDYFGVVEGKASGLFALPMAGAAGLCGSPRHVVEGLQEAARHMGVLFQVQSDVLDLYEEPRRRPGEARRTILVVHALAHACAPESGELREVLEALPGDETAGDALLDVVTRTGSLSFSLDQLDERRRLARAATGLADHPRLVALVSAMCDVLLEPIHGLMADLRARSCSAAG